MNDEKARVREVLDSMNSAWRSGCPQKMRGHLHPDMTMALPGFQSVVRGRDALLASFEEFCSNACVLDYEESEHSIEVVGNCAVATFRFHMLYERPAYREDSIGRDLWVFHREADGWVAVWRTMLELKGDRSPVGSSF